MIAAEISSYQSMNYHYSFIDRKFFKFYQGEQSIFAKSKPLAELKVELSGIVLAQGLLLIQIYRFSVKRRRARSIVARLASFLIDEGSASGSRSNQKRN
jgi:hypothetical protein